jgi:type IV secretion system protein VirD4
MRQGKLIFVVLLLVAAIVGGAFFAGWLTITLLHVEVPLAWNTWLQYFKAIDLPQVAPYVMKIKLAGGVGFGVPLLIWLILLIPLFKTKQQSLHGDASLAHMGDIKQADLLRQTPQGIVIGKFGSHYLWLNGAQHVIMIAPTRSGKTTSVAIPVLCTYQESMVVLDLKGELRKLTSGRRQEMGQRVYAWAPYDDEGRTHRFNPMTLLNGMDAGKRIGEIQTIAAILYPDEAGKDPFWTSQSRAAFTAFASFMFERWDYRLSQVAEGQERPDPNVAEDFPSLERILRLSSGGGSQSTKDMLQTVIKDPKQYPYVSPQTRTVFGNLAGLAEQTFSSVIATMQAPLQQFLSPVLANATNATDFDITTIRRKPTTIFVDIPTNKLDESGKLLNIFFSTVIGNNLTKQLGDEPDLKYQMLMLMDEFTAMGRVDVWAKRISISASYGVRDLCIIQSRAQLRGTYGDNDAQNFITNHGAQIVFTPREQADANEYSEMLGYQTIRKQNRSRSSGSGSSQVSISYSEERRALMLPQEIKELPNDDELIFKEGCKPIRAKKNWFFKDKQFQAWTKLSPVAIVPVAQRTGIKKERSARVFTFNDFPEFKQAESEGMKHDR